MFVWVLRTGHIHGGFESNCPIVTIIESVWGLFRVIQGFFQIPFWLMGELSLSMHESARPRHGKVKPTDEENIGFLLVNIVSILYSATFYTLFVHAGRLLRSADIYTHCTFEEEPF